MKKLMIAFTFIQFLFFAYTGFARIHHDPMKLVDSIDSLVMLQHASGEPGGVVAVLSAGSVLYQRAYGLMNLETDENIDEHTLFDIASVAKQFTAFAIMMLEEEGKLDLDAEIRQYLPDLPAYPHKMTVRHLLQHTSGVPSTDVLRLLAGIPLDQLWTQDDEIRLIKKYPYLNFEPNTEHVYSNAGYSLLANIAEQVSGIAFPIFMDQRVFKPLGMSASFVMNEAVSCHEKIAVGYRKNQGEFEVFSSLDDLSFGGGNILSSLHDMILWGKNILTPGVGSLDFYQRITKPYNTLSNGDTLFYTYGFNVRNYKGQKMVEHSGGVPGFRNQFMVFPEKDLIVFVMFNNEGINTRNIATGIADMFFDGPQEVEIPKQRLAIDFSMADVKAYEGHYLMPDGMEMTFVAEQDTFWLILPGDMRFQLFAETTNKFYLQAIDAQCTFVLSDDGTGHDMIWHQRGRDYPASRIDEIVPIDVADLPLFAGTYHHPELNVNYPVTLENGMLTLHPPATFSKYLGLETIELSHINGDKFYADWLGTLEFTRDIYQQINGFILLNVGRVQHVRFLLVSN